MRLTNDVLRGMGRMRPYLARRELSSPKHTVLPIASGPDEIIVGLSIDRVPDSRFIVAEKLALSLWKTESKLTNRQIFTNALLSRTDLSERASLIAKIPSKPKAK